MQRVRLLTALIIAVAVAGCSSASTAAPAASAPAASAPAQASAAPSSAAATKFAFIGALVHPVYSNVPQALQDAAAAYGISPVPVFTTPQEFDQVQQNTIVDGLIANGYTGLSIQVDDPVAGNDTITKIAAQGIYVVATGGCPEQPTKAPFCMATDTKQMAYLAATNVISAMGGKGNLVHLTGQPQDVNTQHSIDGVAQAIAEHPGIKLIQTITGLDESAQAAANIVSSLLASKRNQIDGIVSTSGDATPEIATEFTRLGEKRIKAVGINISPTTILDAIKAGYLTGTMAQNIYGQGYLAMYSLKLMTEGCTWNGPFNIDTGAFFVNQTNVDNAVQGLAQLTTNLAQDWKTKYWTCP